LQGNYTSLEAFFFGFPLVHNSRLYNKRGVSGVAPLGYYYEMSEDLWDIDGAVAAILDAAKKHPKNLVAQRVAASQYLAAKTLPDSALVLDEFVGTMQGTIDQVLADREQRDSQARPHLKTWGVGV